MQSTTNYGLNKPELTEHFSIEHFNANADIIDEELKKAEEHRTIAENPHKVTKAQVGLGNVDNTADANKPVSTAQQTAIDNAKSSANSYTDTKISEVQEVTESLKTSISNHTSNKSNPHGVTKAQVGLGNVDNTADASKPVSTAQQTAINSAESNAKSYTDEKIAELINGAPSTLDTLKEISDAMEEHENVVEALNEAIGKKANSTDLSTHTASADNPHKVTKAQVGLGSVPNVATNDQTPTYSDTTAFETLSSGETLSTAFAKIKLAITNLINHIANKNNPHSVTAVHVGLGSVPNVATNDQTPTYKDAITLETLSSGEKLSIAFSKIKLAITNLINHLADKSNPHGVTASQVGLGNVPNVATNDQTPTYDSTDVLATLTSGEKMSVAFAKIQCAINKLVSHVISTANPHNVTASQVGVEWKDATLAVTSYGHFNTSVSSVAKYRYTDKVLEISVKGLYVIDATTAEGYALMRVQDLEISIPHSCYGFMWDDTNQKIIRVVLGADGYIKHASNASMASGVYLNCDTLNFVLFRG